MESILKPCPFCGGKANKVGQRRFISCGNMRCDAFGISFSDAGTWNTRVEDARVQLLAKALREARYWLTDGAIPTGEVMADGTKLKWPDSASALEVIAAGLAEAGLDKEPA